MKYLPFITWAIATIILTIICFTILPVLLLREKLLSKKRNIDLPDISEYVPDMYDNYYDYN